MLILLVMKYVLSILYVANQDVSREFYRRVLLMEPVLDVPGMTEFRLNDGALLGLMPENGIAKIICEADDFEQSTLSPMPHPSLGKGIPRCELYLPVDDPSEWLERVVNAGGKAISKASLRNWGDDVAYGCDPDGHVLAFANMVRSTHMN